MNPPTIETTTKRRGPQGPRLRSAPPEARALAAAILDVLAGGRTPQQAADSLKVSLPRYYALEARALDGLVKACAPRPRQRWTQASSGRACGPGRAWCAWTTACC